MASALQWVAGVRHSEPTNDERVVPEKTSYSDSVNTARRNGIELHLSLGEPKKPTPPKSRVPGVLYRHSACAKVERNRTYCFTATN